MERVASLLGLIVFLAGCWFFSERRKDVRPSIIVWGLLLQIILAIFIFGIPVLGVPGLAAPLFSKLNNAVMRLLEFSDAGAKFVFGDLATDKYGFIFAVRVLPTILFVSAIFALSYHLGIMQKIVYVFAWIMRRVMPVGGAESLSTAANIFVGQSEAPIMIKPYLPRLTRSELFCIMVGGMANTAGGVLAAYVMMLKDRVPGIAGHLIAVSVMSAPATFLISKLIIPENRGYRHTGDEHDHLVERVDANIFEALSRGASEGMQLALNVAAMLIAFTACMAFLNGAVQFVAQWFDLQMTLQKIVGLACSPIALLLGAPFEDARLVGQLIGEKIILNEFLVKTINMLLKFAHIFMTFFKENENFRPNIKYRILFSSNFEKKSL